MPSSARSARSRCAKRRSRNDDEQKDLEIERNEEKCIGDLDVDHDWRIIPEKPYFVSPCNVTGYTWRTMPTRPLSTPSPRSSARRTDIFSNGLHLRRRAADRDRMVQLRRAQRPQRPSRARHAGHVLHQGRAGICLAHAHLARADPLHGIADEKGHRAAVPRHRAGQGLPQRGDRHDARGGIFPDRRACRRRRCHARQSEGHARRHFSRELFKGAQVEIRFRPSFFPFTEPSRRSRHALGRRRTRRRSCATDGSR